MAEKGCTKKDAALIAKARKAVMDTDVYDTLYPMIEKEMEKAAKGLGPEIKKLVAEALKKEMPRLIKEAAKGFYIGSEYGY